jgi:uncharacterized protein (DUF342 family)
VGLFDFFKNSDDSVIEKENNSVEFKDTIIESQNVEKDLKKLASKYGLETKDLDFTIISYKNFYRFKPTDKYRLLKEIDFEEILTKENLLNPDFSIRQQYKLNVYKKEKASTFPIKILLETNPDFTKIFATFKKSEAVNYHQALDKEIVTEINKKKLKQGLYIGLFDDTLKESVKKITLHIMVNKAILEDMRFLVCEGIDRSNGYKEFVNLIFQEKRIEENRNISLKNQTNLSTVKKGDIVFEVIKAQEGQDGRNCKGEFLPKSVIGSDNGLKYEDITISDNIEEIDKEDKILFIAKKDGYIICNGNNFDISDDIVVEQINIKTTGSIRAGDKDIKVHVENSDETLDAIGAGVILDTREVKTKGNVANNAKITADLVEINGQTHQSSIIQGKKVKIYLHRGFVEADKVDINTLEGGKVVADDVFIDILSGGEIKAKRIFINRLISNAQLFASELIEITTIDGNTNHIHIDPKAQRGFDEIVSNLEKEISDIEHKVKKYNQELKALKRKILSDKESVEEIKKRILELKAQKQKPPQAMINKIKNDKKNKLEFNNLIRVIKDLKQTQEELLTKKTNFNEAIFDARVVVNSPWKEYNEITFHIVEPKKEVKRIMKNNEIANSLGLKVTKENEYIIANLD